jgi:hypothetical protein
LNQMGFMDFLKGIGNFVSSGIQKVAGVVGKVAPMVSGIAGMIPTPFTQGIAQAANMAGGIANAINPQTGQPAPAAAPAPGAPPQMGAGGAGQAAPGQPPGPVM